MRCNRHHRRYRQISVILAATFWVGCLGSNGVESAESRSQPVSNDGVLETDSGCTRAQDEMPISAEGKPNSSAEVRVVAPLFLHGDGFARSVSFSLLMPRRRDDKLASFLSEEYGRALIESELVAEGVSFDTASGSEELDPIGTGQTGGPFVLLDGYSKAAAFGYAYISLEDLRPLGWARSLDKSQTYDVKHYAEKARAILVAAGAINAVVFYDPVAEEGHTRTGPENVSLFLEQLRSNSEQLLCAQVRDFVVWARAAGWLKH